MYDYRPEKLYGVFPAVLYGILIPLEYIMFNNHILLYTMPLLALLSYGISWKPDTSHLASDIIAMIWSIILPLTVAYFTSYPHKFRPPGLYNDIILYYISYYVIL